MKLIILISLFIGIQALQVKEAKNILFLLPLASKSHRNVFEPLITSMALTHNVTVVSPYPAKLQKNVREINPTNFASQMEEFSDPLKTRREGSKGFIQKMIGKILTGCQEVYQNKEFMELIKVNWDLIYINAFWNECVYAFPYKVNAPFIVVSTMALPAHVSWALGNRLPPSFVPGFTAPYTDRMSFLQRMDNFWTTSMTGVILGVYFVGSIEETYRNYLGRDMPDLGHLMGNVSVVLSNSHFTLTYPRPTLPNIIEVGGMHCNVATKELPNDIQDFVNGAKDGFIYFSLGSIVKANSMPENVRKIFRNVFAKLENHRILWKWETGVMEDVPPNVKLLKWAPQQDILAHKNIKLFITHGGLLSTQEAAYHGVPLVGLPLFADQDLNMKQAENAGNALALEILELSEESLSATIHRILNDKKFSQRAKELSTLLRDQSETALERAVWWSEYVLRHKGAYHIQSAARDLNFFQYHSLDVVATLLFVLGIILWIVKLIIWTIFSKLCGSKNTVKKIKQK